MNSDVDISENLLLRQNPDVMAMLLKDHTTQENIYWATDSYVSMGEGFLFTDKITIEKITGDNDGVIRPRCVKSKEEQTQRTKDKAEVFTPSWICNKQNNLIDTAWFGRENVFNTEQDEENNEHSWTPSPSPIVFSEEKGKGWKDYVRDTRLEITCGEAPYLASRYDTITGEYIPVKNRIGLLDRKLRIVSENTETSGDWLDMAQDAYKNTYGYDWQGDNVLLARENLLRTFIDYYTDKFGLSPITEYLIDFAEIISWNIWQMDGLKYVIPNSCKPVPKLQMSIFEDEEECEECPGCANNDNSKHTGTYCVIKDWEKGRNVKFVSLIREK